MADEAAPPETKAEESKADGAQAAEPAEAKEAADDEAKAAAPAAEAKEDLKWPVEVGTFTLSADGTKVAGGTYDGAVKEVAGSGHSPHLDNPDVVVNHLKEFILN